MLDKRPINIIFIMPIKHLQVNTTQKWTEWFEGIYAQDAFDPILSSKCGVIERVLQIYNISKSDALYFGDRNEDGEADHANGLKFVQVGWGYGDEA